MKVAHKRKFITTKAQFIVCAYTAAGYEAKVVASKIYRSYHTVVEHLKNVKIENGLRNIADVTREFVLAHGDPAQYIKTLLLALQLSITVSVMDADLRKPVRSSRARTSKTRRKVA